ncbi:MAG: glycosyltransferase family 4 protein [Desulfobacterales bacterium]
MKILHIAPSMDVMGGISAVLKGYSQSDMAKRYDLEFIASHRDGPKGYKLLVAAAGLIHTAVKLCLGRFDIVHLHCGDVPSPQRKYIYYRLVRLFRPKVILHFHGAEFMDQFAGLAPRWKSRLVSFFTGVDRLVCLSKSWETRIRSIASQANTIVIPNAIAIPERMDNRKLSPGRLRLAFLGRIGRRKGLFDLLETLAELKSQGLEIELEVGGNGDVEAFLEAVAALGLEEQVRYLGWIGSEQKDLLFRRVDALVLPSYGEGMPMSILEAMAYGLPVIATRVGGIPELVHHGVSGLLTEPGDRKELGRAIKTLTENALLRIRMGEAARSHVSENHHYTAMVDHISGLYAGCSTDSREERST